ncbi:MAG: hypothetical protein ABIA97_04415 [Candidatus Omnitrophota bacterium]
MMKKKKFLKVIPILLIIFFKLSGLGYGKVVHYTLKELTMMSDLIVVGRVIAVQESMVHKLATVKIEEVARGNFANEEITIKTAGRMRRSTVKEEDLLDPDYMAGEHVLLFLRRIENNQYFESSAGFRGKELIKDNGKVSVYFGYSDGEWDFREVSLIECIKYIKSYLDE